MALPDVPEMRSALLLSREREAIGMYLSGHPLDNYQAALSALSVSVTDLQEADGMTGIADNAVVLVGGMLTACKQKPTKSGSGLMGYAVLEGVTGSCEVVLFPRTVQQYANLFLDDSPVLVRGRLNIREDRGNSLLVEELKPLADAVQKTFYLNLPSLSEEMMQRAVLFLKAHPGNTPVVLVDAAKRIKRHAPQTLYLNASEAALREAEQIFGKDNIKLL